jgi:hypothetical protein
MKRICRPMHGPEWHIQRDVIRYLRARGWHVEHTHGNLYQTGFPDLYAAHNKWGTRWIDCKQPKKYSFTRAQKQKWPLWESFRIGIWVLTAGTQEEYDKLFQLPNWRAYWKPQWKTPTQADIDKMLDELVAEELEREDGSV